MGEGREGRALHLDVDDAVLLEPLQVLVLVGLVELAKGAVEAALPLVEVGGAHGLAHHSLVRVIRVRQRQQLADQLLVQQRRPADLLTQDVLKTDNINENSRWWVKIFINL